MENNEKNRARVASFQGRNMTAFQEGIPNQIVRVDKITLSNDLLQLELTPAKGGNLLNIAGVWADFGVTDWKLWNTAMNIMLERVE